MFLLELQKRMRVKSLPTILALHLKRFKYMEQYNRHIKVSHRVVFPLELRLFNTVSRRITIPMFETKWKPCIAVACNYCCVMCISIWLHFQSDDAVNPDRMYDLVAVVVHCGSGPNRGHYISIVKSCGFWLVFDDDLVDVSCPQIYLLGHVL